MYAGPLDRRVQWQRATKTTNDFGEVEETWSTLATLWAAKMPHKAKEEIVAAEVVDKETIRIQIRFRADLSTTDQFILDGRTYRVQSLQEMGRRDGWDVIGAARTDT